MAIDVKSCGRSDGHAQHTWTDTDGTTYLCHGK